MPFRRYNELQSVKMIESLSRGPTYAKSTHLFEGSRGKGGGVFEGIHERGRRILSTSWASCLSTGYSDRLVVEYIAYVLK